MKSYLVLYAATLAVMAVLDLVWLGVLARDFYKSRMGDLLEFHMAPGMLFYLIYAVGVVIFANSHVETWQDALIKGALFGFFAYATYDLTNLATIRDWSLTLAVVDMIWGALVTGLASAGGWLIAGYFTK